jgi:hypothetical protein
MTSRFTYGIAMIGRRIATTSITRSCDEKRKRPLGPVFLIATTVVLAPVRWLLVADALARRRLPKAKIDRSSTNEEREISPFIYQMH